MMRDDMTIMCRCCLVVLFFCGAQAHYSSESNAFHDVIHFLHGPFFDSTNVTLNTNTLEHIYEELFEKAECTKKSANCSECLSDLLAVTGGSIDGLDAWNQGSATALYALLDLGNFCNLTLEEKRQLNGSSSFLSLLSSGPIDEVGEEEIEALIELLEESFSGEDHHEEGGNIESSTPVALLQPTETSTVPVEEEHHSAKCFGEGTLLYYMGLDHEEAVNMSRLSELTGIILSFLVQDWVVSEICPVIPKQTDFLDDLFSSLGDGNTISEEGFEELLEALSIGSVEGGPTTAPDDGHGHKRSLRRVRRSIEDEEESLTSQCMGEATLASVYGFDLEDGISREQFIQLCPALIQQQTRHSCEPANTTAQPVEEEEAITVLQIYGYGTLAVVIISALALLGAVLIPCIHAQIVNYILNMFVAMGVGTMLADALLHLMPQALGIHAHGDEDNHNEEEGSLVAESTLIQLVICAAIYGFYLFESLMSVLKPKSRRTGDRGHGHSHSIQITPAEKDEKDSDHRKEAWSDSDMTSNTDSSQQSLQEEKKGIPTIALMILVGDAIHNFVDGIAIGAAFSTSLQDGLGTSIAVFCHELPHELGDFSILLQAGMSKTKAILFNLLAASMCLIGLYIGAALGSNEEVRKWLLALTAGMFIYVALVNMLPELMVPQKDGKWWIYFIMQNVGMLTGISLMLVISIFEEQIIHGL